MQKQKFLNIPYIPYDKNLVYRAKELRKETTEAEKVFWEKVLKNKKLAHLKFTRQKPLDNFIADFYCASLRLVVEIDGEIHDFHKARDKERDNILEQKFGLKIVRYTNREVLSNVEKIIEDLVKKIQNTTPPDLPLSGEEQLIPPDKGENKGVQGRGHSGLGVPLTRGI